MTERARLLERTAERIADALRVVRGLGPDPWLGVDLTMPQFKVLFLLGHLGPSSVGRLASALRVTLPTVTGILDRLVEHGYLERLEAPEDRRLVLSRLTAKGVEQLERLESAGRARWVRVLDRLTSAELEALLAAVERLNQAAEQEYRAERSCQPQPKADR